MAEASLDRDTLKALMKEALVEALEENRDLLHDVLTEALETFALADTQYEAAAKAKVSREEYFRLLEGEA